ncbi:paramyosin [Etheostoma spectabile]|uniref:paramyosin n=1 Tax=Etheostoma spectabile TaxID=54343 RepID=UPI0013AEB858|nr:paramyosin-like [Etheostoma spectabile]
MSQEEQSGTPRPLSDENAAHHQENEVLIRKNRDLQRQNGELRENIKGLRVEVQYSRKSNKRALQIQNKVLRTENATLRKDADILRSETKALCNEIEEVHIQNKETQEVVHLLEQEKQSWGQKIINLKQDIQKMTQKFQNEKDSMAQEHQALKKDLQEAKDVVHNYYMMAQENEFIKQENHALKQEVKELERKLGEGEEAILEKNTAILEQAQEYRSILQVLKGFVHNYDEMSQENKTLKEDVQELTNKLRDGEEATRRNHETLQQEVQELKDIQQELKVFEHKYNTLKEDNESTGKQKNSLEQELQEVKNMVRLEKDLWAQEQLKASRRTKSLCDEVQMLQTHLNLKMERIEEMQREIESLTDSPEVQAFKVKTIADQINAEHVGKNATHQKILTKNWLFYWCSNNL